MNAIETHGLTKHFGPVRAVEDLDLEVRRGEIFGFLGPNGSGKSTTIRMLFDFIRPTRGTLRVLDGTGADPEIRRRVGYLPAELRVDPRWTARDVIEFFGALRGGVDDSVVRGLLDRFGLDPTRPAGELSTGNRRKIGIVQAFMHEPELLVLDEPTSGLDPLLQHEFHTLVRESVARGATVFLSSHVLPEVEVLADRVGIVRKGRLVVVATIDELRAQARQRLDFYVAGPVDVSQLQRLPEVREVSMRNGTLSLVVDGSVDRVLKALCAYEVQRVVSHDDDLEDIFLTYYQDAAS